MLLILNLSSYGSENYTWVIFSDSKTAFLQDGDYAAFCPFF